MWTAAKLERVRVVYDFTSADCGYCDDRALLADGHRLANLLGFIEIEEDGCFQAIICESCGVVHCQPGGWVAPRRVSQDAVWMPCFDRYLPDQEAEYRPPGYLTNAGVLWFEADAVRELASLVPILDPRNYPALVARELPRLMQWDAPGLVLGRPGEAVSIRRDIVLACDEGDVTEQLTVLEELLNSASTLTQAVTSHSARTLAFYLDLPGTPEWHPLAVDTDGHRSLALRRNVGCTYDQSQ